MSVLCIELLTDKGAVACYRQARVRCCAGQKVLIWIGWGRLSCSWGLWHITHLIAPPCSSRVSTEFFGRHGSSRDPFARLALSKGKELAAPAAGRAGRLQVRSHLLGCLLQRLCLQITCLVRFWLWRDGSERVLDLAADPNIYRDECNHLKRDIWLLETVDSSGQHMVTPMFHWKRRKRTASAAACFGYRQPNQL